MIWEKNVIQKDIFNAASFNNGQNSRTINNSPLQNCIVKNSTLTQWNIKLWVLCGKMANYLWYSKWEKGDIQHWIFIVIATIYCKNEVSCFPLFILTN